MADIQTKKLNIATGAKPSLEAASASDTYGAGPGHFAVVSVGATATTVTLVDPRVLQTGEAAPDVVYSGITSAELWIPLPRYLADGEGRITITCDQVTDVNVACVRVD